MYPIAMHWNARANGTMILTTMMWSPEGVNGIQVGQLNPYNSSEWVQMLECVRVLRRALQLQQLIAAAAGTTATTSPTRSPSAGCLRARLQRCSSRCRRWWATSSTPRSLTWDQGVFLCV